MKKTIVTCLISGLALGHTFAQQTISESNPDQIYLEASHLAQQGYYQASNVKLMSYLTASINQPSYQSEATMLKAINDVKLKKLGSDALLRKLNHSAKNRILSNEAHSALGDWSFDQNQFEAALKDYTLVVQDLLSAKQKVELKFKMAYCYMKTKQPEKAIDYFRQVSYYGEAYYGEALYYMGNLYFDAKDYDQALEVLITADEQNTPYEDPISELIASIYFETKAYSDLVAYTNAKLKEPKTPAHRTFHRLLGEVAFEHQEYANAAMHLQQYLDMSKGKMDAEGYYRLGYAYFQTNNSQLAIENLKKAALAKGDLGQSSSFYLGQLYLQNKNYRYALSAFRNAIDEGENQNMKEESSFLLGKINYSAGSFTEAIDALQEYNTAYPQGAHLSESQDLLARAFLKTSDYNKAIEYIEQAGARSKQVRQSYQSVCFNRAQQLFNDSKFDLAYEYFNKSLKYQEDAQLTLQALYLAGESASVLGRVDDAARVYQKCISLGGASNKWSVQSKYGLAYLAYNNKNWALAKTRFLDFINGSFERHPFYSDALQRLADCYYVEKHYADAIKYYQLASNYENLPKDYVFYQLGITYELSDQPELARKAFNSVLNLPGKSSYKDNAIYRMAESDIERGDFPQAIVHLDDLLENYPESSLKPFALNKRALCYLNMDQAAKAKKDYQEVLDRFISHEVANDALLGLQELIKRGEKVDDFDSYMVLFQQANPDDASLEVIAFEAAKNKYYAQEYAASALAFKKFMSKYPESSFYADVQYYLADSYYRVNNYAAADSSFQAVLSSEQSVYKSRAFDKRGKVLLAMNQLPKALTNYRSFLKYSNTRKEEYMAREGIMAVYEKQGNLDSALYYADLILSESWKPVGAQERILLLKAKIHIDKKQYKTAIDELIEVMNGPVDEINVESRYLLAKTFYLQQNYKQSLEALFDLNRNAGSYPYWIGQSFLLIADNYIAMDELLQAKATLNSIIDNSPEKAVVAAAKKKLTEVDSKEKAVLEKDTVNNVAPQKDSIK